MAAGPSIRRKPGIRSSASYQRAPHDHGAPARHTVRCLPHPKASGHHEPHTGPAPARPRGPAPGPGHGHHGPRPRARLLHQRPLRPDRSHPHRSGTVRHPVDHPLLRPGVRLPGRSQRLDRRHPAHPRRAEPVPAEPGALAGLPRVHRHHLRLVLHDRAGDRVRRAGDLGHRRLDGCPRRAGPPAAPRRRRLRGGAGPGPQPVRRDRARAVRQPRPALERPPRAQPPRAAAGLPALPAGAVGGADGAGVRWRDPGSSPRTPGRGGVSRSPESSSSPPSSCSAVWTDTAITPTGSTRAGRRCC